MTRHRNSPSAKSSLRTKKAAKSMLKSIVSMDFFDQIIKLHDLEEGEIDKTLLSYVEKKNISVMNKDGASNRQYRHRKRWSEFEVKLTDRQFRRYFRMSKECFHLLAERIETNVGEETFKSESYLDDLMHSKSPKDIAVIKMMKAHEGSTGGFISGEVKLALTLRILAGGSYLDLALLYEMSSSSAYRIFHDVVQNWILDDRLVKINGTDYLNDEDRLQKVALEFSRSSGGIFNGCIGAIDGWIVKIRKPSIKDNVSDTSSFFSRKGFFGLNVVAIVDKKKRVLYRVIASRGAEHDSTAFKSSKLYGLLMNKWQWLKEKGFYFIGDSAYSLKSFILTPFDGVRHGTAEDNYNFFQSSQRICVECAFGEIDLRWGILWRPLQFSMKHNTQVIDACMRLHNFIVDFREEHEPSSTGISAVDKNVFTEDCRRFMAGQSGVGRVGVHGGEREVRRNEDGTVFQGGRPSQIESQTTKEGKDFRDRLRDFISYEGGVRPRSNWYRENNRFLN
jgi:hypothetical protein